MDIVLCSPSSTCSVLLHRQDDEDITQSLKLSMEKRLWSFMSLQFWGEEPTGTWLISFRDNGKGTSCNNKNVMRFPCKPTTYVEYFYTHTFPFHFAFYICIWFNTFLQILNLHCMPLSWLSMGSRKETLKSQQTVSRKLKQQENRTQCKVTGCRQQKIYINIVFCIYVYC